ncbi:MAG: response regulator transcription factor [Planctomycetota bacterium]
MAEQLKLLVFEDNEDDFVLLRERVARLEQFDAELILEKDASDAAGRVRDHAPTVVLLDYRLSGTDGIEVLKSIRSSGIATPVIVLTGQGDQYIAAEITRAGADAYLVKDDLDTPRLPEALRGAVELAGRTKHQNHERSDTLSKLQTLTPREAEVLDQIINGLTNKQIAAKLHRSVETIKVHRAHIMSKVQADSTADLVRRVMTARLG